MIGFAISYLPVEDLALYVGTSTPTCWTNDYESCHTLAAAHCLMPQLLSAAGL